MKKTSQILDSLQPNNGNIVDTKERDNLSKMFSLLVHMIPVY